jgi:hypothetical protein
MGISMILCSISLLICSVKGNTASAQGEAVNGYDVAGVIGAGISKYDIIGYNPKTGATKILTAGRY